VKDILAMARAQLAVTLRERITFFWFIAFPILLLVLLSLIFANVGKTGDLSFEVSVVNLDAGAGSARHGEHVATALRALGSAVAPGETPPFQVRFPEGGADAEVFLAAEIEALKVGKRDIVVAIPEGFSESLMLAAGGAPGAAPARVIVHTSGGRTSSDMARGILEQVVARIDREILTQLGKFDAGQAVALARIDAGVTDRAVAYVDFLVPGVILMGFFTAGLFSVPGTILFGREQRILRRYWVTPLGAPRFLAGFALGHMALCTLQAVCVWGLGRLAFGARVDLLQPLAVAYLAVAMVTFLAIGFLIAAVARTGNAGMAIANIVNMPLMFLGGLFFPTGSPPPALRSIMLANPVTYLADGLRASVGVSTATYGVAVTFAVPCVWIIVCLGVASLRLKWDVGQ
jgi:ABC-2 type transport system permease protein